MVNIFKNISAIFGKTLLGILSVCVALLIISQLLLWGGINWLNTNKGGLWLQNQINIALENSAYQIEFEGFRYFPLTKLIVNDLRILDEDGILFTANDTNLGFNIASIPMRDLSLKLIIDKATLQRLPASETAEKAEFNGIYLSKFSLPNIYFNTLNISTLKINTLKIDEKVTGQSFLLSPVLNGKINFNNNVVDIDLKLQPDILNISDIPYLPNQIQLTTQFDSEKSFLNLENLNINSDLYDISASGKTRFREGGNVDFVTSIKSDNLSQINQTVEGKLDAEIKASGTQDSLILNLRGALSLPILEQRGLDDIILNAQKDYNLLNPNKLNPFDIVISSSYQNIPVTLNSEIEKSDDIILASNIKGSAPDIDLEGDIEFNLKTLLANGALKASIQDLSKYEYLIQQDISGKAFITSKLSANNNNQQVSLNILANNIQYQNIKIGKLNADAMFPNIENIWPNQFDVQVNDLIRESLILEQALGTLKITKNESYALTLKGNGNFNVPFSFDTTADLKNLKTNNPSAHNINANVELDNQDLFIKGKINKDFIDIDIKSDSINLKQLSNDIPDILQNSNLDVKANIEGKMNNPKIKADLDLSAFSLNQKIPQIKLNMIGKYQNGQANIYITGDGKAIDKLNANVSTPLTLSLYPFEFNLPQTQSITGDAVLDLDLDILSALFLPPNYNLSGSLNSTFDMSGSIDNPIITGNANVINSEFSDENLGINLYDLNSAIKLDRDRVTITSLTANDNEEGILTANGFIGLNNFLPKSVALNLDLENFHLLDSDLVDGTFNADLELTSDKDLYNLSGTVQPNYIDITIPEKFTSNIPELNIVEQEEEQEDNILSKVKVAIDFIANNKIFVRGWGLDAELGGKVQLDGNLDDPNFNGKLEARRGRYTEFGKRFELIQADLNFLGRIPANPVLDIIAETEVDNIKARVNIGGTIEDPKISFSAIPSLPEDEVLALILFGRDLSSISPFQAVQLTQTLRRFSGQGGACSIHWLKFVN